MKGDVNMSLDKAIEHGRNVTSEHAKALDLAIKALRFAELIVTEEEPT